MLVRFFICLVLTFPLMGRSQSMFQQMVDTEIAFAKYAADSSVRSAFLQYLDSGCINFSRGQVVNAYNEHLKSKDNDSRLLWKPEAGAISYGGDLGFTTGPFQVMSAGNKELLHGHFTSIWRKQGDKWKNILDIGISYRQRQPTIDGVRNLVTGAKSAHAQLSGEAVDPEETFIKEYTHIGHLAYRNVVVEETWFSREGYYPYHSPSALDSAISTIPLNLEFRPIDSGISASRDMLYVYGSVELNGRPDNYLRIWVREAGKWHLLLQLLNW